MPITLRNQPAQQQAQQGFEQGLGLDPEEASLLQLLLDMLAPATGPAGMATGMVETPRPSPFNVLGRLPRPGHPLARHHQRTSERPAGFDPAFEQRVGAELGAPQEAPGGMPQGLRRGLETAGALGLPMLLGSAATAGQKRLRRTIRRQQQDPTAPQRPLRLSDRPSRGERRVPQPVSIEDYLEVRNKQQTRSGYLTQSSAEELANHRVFANADGTVAYALSPEGDLQGVVNVGKIKGEGREAVIGAIENGAVTLDALGPWLRKYYERFGFEVTESVPFDDALAPATWDFAQHGRPDVFFMRYNEELPRDATNVRRREIAARNQRSGRAGAGGPGLDAGNLGGGGLATGRAGAGPALSRRQDPGVELHGEPALGRLKLRGRTPRTFADILAEFPREERKLAGLTSAEKSGTTVGPIAGELALRRFRPGRIISGDPAIVIKNLVDESPTLQQMNPQQRDILLSAATKYLDENLDAAAVVPSYNGLLELFEQGRDNMFWYDTVRQEAERLWGKKDASTFLNILAATSPRTDAPGNASLAIQLMLRLRAGQTFDDLERLQKSKRPQDPEALERLRLGGGQIQPQAFSLPPAFLEARGVTPEFMQAQGVAPARIAEIQAEGAKRPSMLLPAHMNNIRNAIEGKPLSGFKVGAFSENLHGNLQRGTIDTWMLRAFGLFEEVEGKTRGKRTIKDVGFAMETARLAMVESWLQGMAREAGVEPAHMQAAMWVAQKTLDAEKSAAGGMRLESPAMMGRSFAEILRDESAIAVQEMQQRHRKNPAMMKHLKALGSKVKDEMGLLMALGGMMVPMIQQFGFPSQGNVQDYGAMLQTLGLSSEATSAAIQTMQDELPPAES